GDDDIDAKRSRPSIGKPVTGHASKRRELLVGTDQRITSGPAATAAASRQRQSSKRKQAGYMAAPERFAETSDSSCTAGAVHTWPVSTVRGAATSRQLLRVDRTYRGHRGIDAIDRCCRKSRRGRSVE